MKLTSIYEHEQLNTHKAKETIGMIVWSLSLFSIPIIATSTTIYRHRLMKSPIMRMMIRNNNNSLHGDKGQ